MAIGGIDIASLFGLQQAVQPQQQGNNFMQALQPLGQDEIRRRAIAKALIAGGQKLATTPGNFGTGLAQAIPTGAGAFVEGRDALEDENRKRAKALLEQAMATRKLDDTAEYRERQLDVRERQGDLLDAYRKGVLDQGQQRIEQGNKRLDLGERKFQESLKKMMGIRDPFKREEWLRGHMAMLRRDRKIDDPTVWRSDEDRAAVEADLAKTEADLRELAFRGIGEKGDLQPGYNQARPAAPAAPQAPAAPKAAQAQPTRVRNPKTGQVIVFRGGRWVDEKTGAPVQ